MKKFTCAIFLMAAQAMASKLSLPNEHYTLPNGLQVILSEDHSTPFVAVNTWTYVGSNNEKLGQTGKAHLFEHLMFEGTAHLKDPPGYFPTIERAGGFAVNASTSFDRTNYYQTVPKNELERVLSMESSRLFFLDINQAKLDEQREVVQREKAQRYDNNPYGQATLTFWEKVFPKGHPMHGRVIGSYDDLKAASLNDIQSFYDVNYGPSNSCLTIVGDFDTKEAKALIEKYYGTLPKSKTIDSPLVPTVKLEGQEIVHFDEKLGKVPLVRIHYITPALFAPGDAEMDITAHILAGGEYGRLTKAITRDKPLASSVSAFQQSLEHLSVFTIDAVLNPGVDENEVIKEIDEALASLVTKPASKAEVDRAVNSILTDQFFGIQELGGSSGRAELLQIYNRFAQNPDSINQDIKRYQAVDQNALKIAAEKYLPVGKARKILIAKPVSNNVAAKGN